MLPLDTIASKAASKDFRFLGLVGSAAFASAFDILDDFFVEDGISRYALTRRVG